MARRSLETILLVVGLAVLVVGGGASAETYTLVDDDGDGQVGEDLQELWNVEVLGSSPVPDRVTIVIPPRSNGERWEVEQRVHFCNGTVGTPATAPPDCATAAAWGGTLTFAGDGQLECDLATTSAGPGGADHCIRVGNAYDDGFDTVATVAGRLDILNTHAYYGGGGGNVLPFFCDGCNAEGFELFVRQLDGVTLGNNVVWGGGAGQLWVHLDSGVVFDGPAAGLVVQGTVGAGVLVCWGSFYDWQGNDGCDYGGSDQDPTDLRFGEGFRFAWGLNARDYQRLIFEGQGTNQIVLSGDDFTGNAVIDGLIETSNGSCVEYEDDPADHPEKPKILLEGLCRQLSTAQVARDRAYASCTDVGDPYNLFVVTDTARVEQPAAGGMLSMMPESDNCLANASTETVEKIRLELASPATPGSGSLCYSWLSGSLVDCAWEETKRFQEGTDRWFLSYATHRALADVGATECDVEFVRASSGGGTAVLGEEGSGGVTPHSAGNGTVRWGATGLALEGERAVQNLTSSLAPSDAIQVRLSDPPACTGSGCCFGQAADIGPFGLEFNHWTENLRER